MPLQNAIALYSICILIIFIVYFISRAILRGVTKRYAVGPPKRRDLFRPPTQAGRRDAYDTSRPHCVIVICHNTLWVRLYVRKQKEKEL